MDESGKTTPQGDGGDKAPGGSDGAGGGAVPYLIGLGLAGALTLASFFLPGTGIVYGPAIPVLLIVLAIAQMGVHLVFFLHLTTAPDHTNNALALAFGTLIVALVLVGSLWIMANLNANMLPMTPGMAM